MEERTFYGMPIDDEDSEKDAWESMINREDKKPETPINRNEEFDERLMDIFLDEEESGPYDLWSFI